MSRPKAASLNGIDGSVAFCSSAAMPCGACGGLLISATSKGTRPPTSFLRSSGGRSRRASKSFSMPMRLPARGFIRMSDIAASIRSLAGYLSWVTTAASLVGPSSVRSQRCTSSSLTRQPERAAAPSARVRHSVSEEKGERAWAIMQMFPRKHERTGAIAAHDTRRRRPCSTFSPSPDRWPKTWPRARVFLGSPPLGMATLFAPRRPEAAATGLAGPSPAAPNARQVRPAAAVTAAPASRRISASAFARGREAAALLLFVSSVFLSLALASYAHSPIDPALEGSNWVGPVGAGAASFLIGTIGITAWTVPVELLMLTWPLLKNRSSAATLARLAGDFLVVIIVAALVQVALPGSTINGAMPAAGSVGELFGELMRSLFSTIGSFLIGLTAIALILINRASFSFIAWAQRTVSGTEVAAQRAAGAGRAVAQAWERAADLRRQREAEVQRLGPVVHSETPNDVIIAALAPESDQTPSPPVLHVDGAARAADVQDGRGRRLVRLGGKGGDDDVVGGLAVDDRA
ncbi:MAG: hypothetical protein EOO75_02805, partial [Myxococcales bacterium]